MKFGNIMYIKFKWELGSYWTQMHELFH